jgi:hypothetical protein
MDCTSKEYAQNVYNWLKNQNIQEKSRLRLSRIFKAAGPGQVKDSYALATCVEDTKNIQILEVILCGILKLKMDVLQAKNILSNMGYFIPATEGKRSFLRVIEGALEILHPGFFNFSDEEYVEIKNGLRKRMEVE